MISTRGVCVCQHFDSGEFIVMAEVYRHLTSTALQRIAQQIVATVARHFQLKSDKVILLARGKLLKHRVARSAAVICFLSISRNN